ncbi:MAG: dihydrodipicolinate synthase family protein [Cytophagales bacterium]|nr:dihydrodipicolinate synthase family protein [Cytophagales bacterium]
MTTHSRIPHSGVWPALLTPLNADLSIDMDSFANHTKALLSKGCTGVTPFGTTGEGPSFSVAERIAAVDGLIARGVPANRILVSTSCAALPDVVTLTRHATEVGAHGCLMLPPFFLKNVPEQGVVDSYRLVIDAVADSRLKMVLYHLPQITHVNLTQRVIDTLLAQYPNTFIGIKDSSGNSVGSLAFAHHSNGMQVWVGNEPDLRTMAAVGSAGAVSGVGNVMPKLLGRLTSKFDANGYDKQEAQNDLARVKAFIDILNRFNMTAAFKGIMAIKNNDASWRRVRPPLVSLSDAEFDRLQAMMKIFSLDAAHD